MAYELRPLRGFGAAPIMAGGMADRFLARGDAAPRLSTAALDNLQTRAASQVTMTTGTISAADEGWEHESSLVADAGGGDAALCDCMLNAIPGIADDEANLAAGRTLCLQDPALFAEQLAAAGIATHCGADADSDAGGVRAFLSTTAGRVAVGVGVAAILGLGAFFVLR